MLCSVLSWPQDLRGGLTHLCVLILNAGHCGGMSCFVNPYYQWWHCSVFRIKRCFACQCCKMSYLGLAGPALYFFSFGQQHNEKHTGMTRATVSASCATPGNNTLPPHLPGFPYGGGHWAQRGSRAIGQGSEVKGHSLSHWLGGGNWSTSPTSAYCLSPSRNISLKRSRTFSYRETHIVHVTSCLGTPNTSIILVLCQMSAIDFWQIFWSGLTNSILNILMLYTDFNVYFNKSQIPAKRF